jgi:hypothetical protein
MSVKLNDLIIKPENGKLVIGKPNKRGHLQSSIDIGTPIVKQVIEMLTTKEGQFICHQKVETETNEVKYYKITCHEMNKEEIEKMKENDKIREKNNQRKQASLMGTLYGMMLNGFGNKNLILK